MSPETRILRQVTIESAAEADRHLLDADGRRRTAPPRIHRTPREVREYRHLIRRWGSERSSSAWPAVPVGQKHTRTQIARGFSDAVTTLSHDYYYRAYPDLTYTERTKLNYDHPRSFETDLMIEQIRMLREGLSVERPVYSFVEHNRLPETVRVIPSKVLIVEGILIFECEELRKLMDIKVFVDTDADIRLARRILRDVQNRGRSMESVIRQYLETVKPMHDEFVEPSKRHADVIIPEGGFNSVAVQMLIENIKSLTRNN